MTIRKDATKVTKPTKTTDAATKTMKSTTVTAMAVKSNRQNNSIDGDAATNADGDATSGATEESKKIVVPQETSLAVVLVADRMES